MRHAYCALLQNSKNGYRPFERQDHVLIADFKNIAIKHYRKI